MNNKIKKNQTAVDFNDYLGKQLKSPRIKENYDEYGKQLEIAYQILQLRKKRKMSQSQLAKKLKTKQSNIARMEAGQQNFTTETLQRIANIFNHKLKVEFVK